MPVIIKLWVFYFCKKWFSYLFLFFFFLSFFFFLFEATSMAHGSSQARGWIRATAAGLYHSHSNAGSEPHLRPTLQLKATLDLWPTEWGQGLNPHPHGYWLDSFLLHHKGKSERRFSFQMLFLQTKTLLKFLSSSENIYFSIESQLCISPQYMNIYIK